MVSCISKNYTVSNDNNNNIRKKSWPPNEQVEHQTVCQIFLKIGNPNTGSKNIQ